METTMTKTNGSNSIFESEEFGKLRIVMVEGEPYFVGKEVAEILGYERPTKATVDRVDEDDRIMVDGKTQSHFGIELGQRGGWLINESGLYSLILSSKLSKAKEFKRWVTSEVLPSIRKHGAYMTPEQIEKVLLNPDTIIKIATELKEEQEKNRALSLENDRQQQIIEEQKPAVEFTRKLTQTEDTIDFNEFAKMLYEKNKFTIGRNKIFQWARNKNILTKNNMPYQQYVQQGYFKVIEVMKFASGSVRVYPKVLITGKGQPWLAKKLLADYNIK